MGAEHFSLPLPFCQAVYQDKLRKDVKKIIAVATVPFLSLISFQRCLSSAEYRGPRSCRCLPPSFICLQGVETVVGAGIWGRHTVKKKQKTALVTRTVNSFMRWEREVLGRTLSLGASFLVAARRALFGSSCTVIRRPVTSQLPSVTRQLTWSVKI